VGDGLPRAAPWFVVLVPRFSRRAMRLPALVSLLLAARVVAQAPPDTRPAVAVMYFTNGAMEHRADYEPFTRGIANMLMTGLGTNTGIRLVERDQLQKVLDEGALGRSGRVDAETAVQVGKIVNAHHMIFGGFIIEPGGRIRIDARAVDVTTSEIEHVDLVEGKTTSMFALIDQLAAKLSRGMRLPPMPVRPRDPEALKPRPEKWLVLYSRAMLAEDRHQDAEAIALYKQVLDEAPGFEPAVASLRRLTGSTQERR
jgi:TolB-like protein